MGSDPKHNLPVLAITMGDPAGIGPEIIVKALGSAAVWRVCRPLVIGSIPVMERMAKHLKSSLKVIAVLAYPDSTHPNPIRKGYLPVLDPFHKPLGSIRMGKPGKVAGTAAVRCVETAVELAVAHHVSGIVTAPINKEAIHLAGYSYPGHTELLGSLTSTKDFGMMLLGGPLKIVFVTTHLSIRSLPKTLTTERVARTIRLAHDAMSKYFGVPHPKIGVAALNPHAGEHGLFGDEEQRIIGPATTRARRAGMNITDPLPADTLFGKAVRGEFDVIVAMYHDQGLIPLKTVAFGECVNVTIGLPILRTSVDHGTAYDI
ncbi:MAG: 4-hydroxythreonine-4-phosphate dehydrogenase PdxA, partial [Nitrospirota bacterium]|nr:4-hydroxythreonine-4-phosphate dehydrogenase PdxA [Nitrospirota bacterium]